VKHGQGPRQPGRGRKKRKRKKGELIRSSVFLLRGAGSSKKKKREKKGKKKSERSIHKVSFLTGTQLTSRPGYTRRFRKEDRGGRREKRCRKRGGGEKVSH